MPQATTTTLHKQMTVADLHRALEGGTAAIRLVTNLVPAGGFGDKVFPPTYEGSQYAIEDRVLGDGLAAKTVLLDSVQSQANRMEQALRFAVERGEVKLPLLVVDFGKHLPRTERITSLDAPHRIADAIFRDSLLGKTPFRESPEGKRFAEASTRNATPLLELCPHALVFGVWDSTGALGGLGAKFARALVSEIVGHDAVPGVKTASRMDPLRIPASIPVYADAKRDWTIDEDKAVREKDKVVLYGGKDAKKRGKPSALNHGNVTPSIVRAERSMEPIGGGVTISKAVQTTVLSLPALRRLSFPGTDGKRSREADLAAQTLLAALALVAICEAREQGYDLRSRCLLVPETGAEARFEVVSGRGQPGVFFDLEPAGAREMFSQAVAAAKKAGLPWRDEEILLAPAPKLVDLVKRADEINRGGGEGEE